MEKWKVTMEMKNGEVIKKEAPYNSDDEYDVIKEQIQREYKDLIWFDIRYSAE